MMLLLQIAILMLIMAFIVKYLLVHPSAILRIVGKATKAAADRRNILFVTAHPDDECMFFAPSILKFSRFCNVYLLCLSSGNFAQHGETRKKELLASGVILGLPKDRVFIIDNENFKDGPNEVWGKELLSFTISSYVKTLSVNTLITFDEYGVSGHANHQALYQAVQSALTLKKFPKGVKAYKLVSTHLLRKYISVFDVAYSCLTSDIYLVSGWSNIRKAQRAMLKHQTQLVWFRWLYMLFSRYMLINTLQPFNCRPTEAETVQ